MTILHWRQSIYREDEDGGYVDERTCIEHPRLSHLQQCGRTGGTTTTSFHIEGIANYFGTVMEALDALRANPRPDDIVAVPPMEVSDG